MDDYEMLRGTRDGASLGMLLQILGKIIPPKKDPEEDMRNKDQNMFNQQGVKKGK